MGKIFDILNRKVQNAMKGLPTVVGNAAVNWSQSRFVQQNWISDTASEDWEPRRYENKKSRGRKILIQTGRLWRAIQIVETGERFVSIGVLNVPYAAIHNYGGEIHQSARSETFVRDRVIRGVNKGRFKKMKQSVFRAGSAQGFSFGERVIHMPKRQFIGNSKGLIRYLTEVSQQYISKKLT
jgi:phage gpG-like protein